MKFTLLRKMVENPGVKLNYSWCNFITEPPNTSALHEQSTLLKLKRHTPCVRVLLYFVLSLRTTFSHIVVLHVACRLTTKDNHFAFPLT